MHRTNVKPIRARIGQLKDAIRRGLLTEGEAAGELIYQFDEYTGGVDAFVNEIPLRILRRLNDKLTLLSQADYYHVPLYFCSHDTVIAPFNKEKLKRLHAAVRAKCTDK